MEERKRKKEQDEEARCSRWSSRSRRRQERRRRMLDNVGIMDRNSFAAGGRVGVSRRPEKRKEQ